jgi:hypothetical protein
MSDTGVQPESAEENYELEVAVGQDELSQDERAELERLRGQTAELEHLRARIAELERRPAETAEPPSQPVGAAHRRHVGWRAPVAVVLIVLGCILAPLAVISIWAGDEVSNTGRYVATVEPLIQHPAIQNYLTDQITNQITSRLNLTGIVNQASAQLSSKGLTRISSLLTQFGPQIASSVTGFIHSTVHSIIASPAMATAWVQVNTIAHQSLVKVLSGQGNGAISTSNGQIVVNLGPFIAVAKQDLVAHGFTLANSIPPVTPTLALFQARDLGQAQTWYRLLTTLKIALPILVLLLFGAGVYVARGRRRALVGAGLGLAASMLILGIGLDIARAIYLNSVPSSTLPSDAAAAGYDAIIHFLREGLRAVLAVGLVVAFAAYFTGPSPAAVRTRSGLKSGLGRIRDFGESRGMSTGPAGRWTYLHRRSLRIGALALAALIFVSWGDPTALVVILIVVVLLLILGLIELIGRPAASLETAPP